MAKIAAEPNELRQFAEELRQSAGRLAGLGREAVTVARAAGYPGAVGAEVEAAAFEASVRVHGVETDLLAFRTARAADLFEAADGPFFGVPGLIMLGKDWRSKVMKVRGLWKHLPHSTKPKVWRQFWKELQRGRSQRARYWGFGDAGKTLGSWGRSRWQTLRHPKSSLVKFAHQGKQAFKAVQKKGPSLLRRIAPLKKFGKAVAKKVLFPLAFIDSYKNSKGKGVIAKFTSATLQTAATWVLPVAVVDVVTGGQVSSAVDGVVTGVDAAEDEQRLAQWSDDARAGKSGRAMQKMQAAGDDMSNLYDNWQRWSHGQ
jgi:hypothetical protein